MQKYNLSIFLAFLALAVFFVKTCLAEGDSLIFQEFGLLKDDYKNFYLDKDNLIRLGIGVGSGAVLANTSIDGDIQKYYRDDIRGETTDDVSKVLKVPGNVFVTIPILFGTHIFLKDTRAGEWAQKSLRAIVVGTPAVLFLQRATGARRPSEGDSKWRPFEDSNGLSGHAFIGAVPFITAAKMNDNAYIKVALYGLSILPALSMINDNKHYFSQTALGWYLALLSCNSVERTGKLKETTFTIIPILHGGALIVNMRF